MVMTKRIYEPAAPADGLRVLVMRLWPRGIRKEAVNLWLKELGADRDLLRDWKQGLVDWPERRRRYLAGLEHPPAAAQLEELRALARAQSLTLLCACRDEDQCHRSLLKTILEPDSGS
jgi:uncharacterized protein YeaO (DUF488 family)